MFGGVLEIAKAVAGWGAFLVISEVVGEIHMFELNFGLGGGIGGDLVW